MSLTLEQKTACAASRAVEHEAEKHFFDGVQPFFPLGFSICSRFELVRALISAMLGDMIEREEQNLLDNSG